jgi:hypothetical protein
VIWIFDEFAKLPHDKFPEPELALRRNADIAQMVPAGDGAKKSGAEAPPKVISSTRRTLRAPALAIKAQCREHSHEGRREKAPREGRQGIGLSTG